MQGGHNSGMGKSRFIVIIPINNTAKIWHIVQQKYAGEEDFILLIQDFMQAAVLITTLSKFNSLSSHSGRPPELGG